MVIKGTPVEINITPRQAHILSISLSMLYDEIGKSGEGKQMKEDIQELAKSIQSVTSKELSTRN